MKFQQLNAFKAVYELGSVTAAGDSLHLTQPAVSKLIAALEHRVNFKLFERIRGRLIPTDQGKAFYFEVSKAFNAMDTLKESARDIQTQHWGSLNIASCPLFAQSYLPRLLALNLKVNSELKGSLKAYRSEEVFRRTEIQSCDVGFAITDDVSLAVNSKKVQCDFVCILPKGSILAEKTDLGANDFASVPFIRGETDFNELRVDKEFAKAGIKRNEVIEVSFASSTATLVAEGVGAAIVDPFTAHLAKIINPDVSVRPFTPAIPFIFYILFPALRPVSNSVNQLIESFFEMAKREGIDLVYNETQPPKSD